ncbi:MAG TPA: cytochrome c [Hyphomonadaceae bacterium]|nr:cytochrome c [Hyphomonadaceae bacterium]
MAACAGMPSPAVIAAESEQKGWSGAPEPNHELIQSGFRIAKEKCAACHAIDGKSKSPLKGAPPLKDILALYDDMDELEYRFIDGMRVGHDQMPRFDFDVRTADALIAYIQAVSAGMVP